MTRQQARPSLPTAAPPRSVAVRWRLGSWTSSAPGDALTITASHTGAAVHARAVLTRTGRVELDHRPDPAPLDACTWQLDERGLLHVHLPGLLTVTLRPDTGQILYAATPMLRALGLPGGTYEVDRAAPTW